MRLPDELNQQYLYEMLVAREIRAATGVGDGIATPHAPIQFLPGVTG